MENRDLGKEEQESPSTDIPQVLQDGIQEDSIIIISDTSSSGDDSEEEQGADNNPNLLDVPRISRIADIFLGWAMESYKRASREGEREMEVCSICFESMQRDQVLMVLPCCHRFHQPCIMPWLRENQNCPICRTMF